MLARIGGLPACIPPRSEPDWQVPGVRTRRPEVRAALAALPAVVARMRVNMAELGPIKVDQGDIFYFYLQDGKIEDEGEKEDED